MFHGHAKVHVVVPWDEAMVADGTEHGAAKHEIGDVIALARLLEMIGYP